MAIFSSSAKIYMDSITPNYISGSFPGGGSKTQSSGRLKLALIYATRGRWICIHAVNQTKIWADQAKIVSAILNINQPREIFHVENSLIGMRFINHHQ